MQLLADKASLVRLSLRTISCQIHSKQLRILQKPNNFIINGKKVDVVKLDFTNDSAV